tara:strand:+ start:5010 stop:6005 length:996 start_codon:yes stop_codon:yes gene_type:complete
MSRIVRFHKIGGPEVLCVDEVSDIYPGPNEVRINVKAIGLNRAEVMLREGIYHEKPKFPSRLGYEAAGVIDLVGDDVSCWKVGDIVSTIPSFSLSQTNQGVYGESAIVPAEVLSKYPSCLTPIQGAAIWMQYLTAYGALVSYGNLKSGQTVIVTAASSSVGIAAIQLVTLLGAEVIAVTRNNIKKPPLYKLGAQHVIVTEEEDLIDEVKKITNGRGADLAFDPIAGPALNLICNSMANHGKIFEYGALYPGNTNYPLMPMLARSLSIIGYQVLDFVLDSKNLNPAKEFIVEQIESGELDPIIDSVFPLDKIQDAHRYMESNKQLGKIVVTT